jgi:hypothetical protein
VAESFRKKTLQERLEKAYTFKAAADEKVIARLIARLIA